MDRLEQLAIVYDKLYELYTRYLISQNTRDKRRRDKAIRDARKEIENYSSFIPLDIKEIFDEQVGANSLNFQHADDIGQCIAILEKLIKEERDKIQ